MHAYVAAPGGKTAYLSELQSGSEVLVVDPGGRQRTAVVGRIKVEQRPLVSHSCVFNAYLHMRVVPSKDSIMQFGHSSRVPSVSRHLQAHE